MIQTASIPVGNDEDFLTLPEVAEILRVPVNTLRWWRQRGDGPPRAEAPDCAWMGAEGASLGHLDRSRVAQSGRDPRIAAAVALEPDYRSAFRAPAGVAGVPTLFLSLGEPQPVSPGLPQAESAALPGATDSDAFPACTAAGPRILSAEGGDPALCGASRAARDAAHGAIADRIRAFLARRAGW